MATKEKLLELFETNKGTYFSGEEIAQTLGISRTAVWKNVKALQGEGYAITAVTNKGYSLSEQTDILSPQGIQKYLNLNEAGKMVSNVKIDFSPEIVVLPVTTSTNANVREKAMEGATEGYTVIANEQTQGRGRRGRSFFAPAGTGIYMSILLRPQNIRAEQAVCITTIAAVAVCEAIEAVSDEKAQIKWVNDVFVRGKKVCGILTEASLGMENGLLEYAILGIGINVYRPEGGFGELETIAGAVLDAPKADAKNKLAAEVMNSFMKYYSNMEQSEYVKEYQKRSLAIGRQVNVLSGNDSRQAQVLSVDEECRLHVRYEDGTEETLSSGEISIRF